MEGSESQVTKGSSGPGEQGSAERYQIGDLLLDVRQSLVSRAGQPIPLPPLSFELLLALSRRAPGVVRRQELLDAVWPDEYVGDETLSQRVRLLRESLGDLKGEPRYVASVRGWGYKLIPAVERLNGEAAMPVAVAPKAVAVEEQGFAPIAEEPKTDARAKARKLVVACAAILLLIASAAVGLYLHSKPTKLTDRDMVIVGDFANSTGDAVFDDALKTALTVALAQSPFINLLPQSKVSGTLKLMTLPPEAKLTGDVAREVCQRTGSKAYIAGSIASLGGEYVLELKAVNCANGDVLAEQQVTSASKENVLNVLGEAAAKLRSQLGESLATVQRFDVPLAEATTSSMEALQAYSLGMKAFYQKGVEAAIPYDLEATRLDSNFAMAYRALAGDYHSLEQIGRASEYYSKAFELREHASQREKLIISANYYEKVTGELNEAARTYQEFIDNYPRSALGYASLGAVYLELGQYETSAEVNRQAQGLAQNRLDIDGNLANALVALQRFDEARQLVQAVQAKKLDSSLLHFTLYGLAFLKADAKGMEDELRWLEARPDVENFGLALAADTEAYRGHLAKARELTTRSLSSAARADGRENGAVWLENAALREAAFGNLDVAALDAAKGVKLAPDSQGVALEAALAYALAGDASKRRALEQELIKRYPLNTQLQVLWLPAIQAQAALRRNDVPAALGLLQNTLPPIEYGLIPFVSNLSCLYPTYIRGQAYLAAGQGKEAAAEFQKILDHSGIVWNCWTGALARLGVARGNALQAKNSSGVDADAARTRALAAYRDFLTLWQDADPDIPIYKEAKAEYAKLQ